MCGQEIQAGVRHGAGQRVSHVGRAVHEDAGLGGVNAGRDAVVHNVAARLT